MGRIRKSTNEREELLKSGDKLESNNENTDTRNKLDKVAEKLKISKRRGSRRIGSILSNTDSKRSPGMSSDSSTIVANNIISSSPSSSNKAISSPFNSSAAATTPRFSTPNESTCGSDSGIIISNSRMTRRSTMRTRSSKTCTPSSVIISTSVTLSDSNETGCALESAPILPPSTTASPNNQTNQLNATELDNGRSESASTAQVAPELVAGGAQPSTPRTPSTPPDHSHGNNTPNPPTPGNTNANSMISSSPQYVTITVDGDTSVGAEGVNSNSSYVTYVEGSNDHSNLYTTATNGQTMSYPVYSVGEPTGVYNTNAASTQYYSATSTGASTSYTQEGGVYMIPSTGGNSNVAGDVDGAPNITHATRVSPATRRIPVRRNRLKRELFYGCGDSDSDEQSLLDDNNENGSVPVITEEDLNRLAKMNMYPVANGALPSAGNSAFKSCPVTVQWLLENYETAEGVSLPRYTMYYHYLRHCADHKLDPVNAASFGKLIRSVFLGLRTRRLGTRGNSKYHYYGIRLKPNSTLNQLYDDGTPINGPNGYYTVNGRGTGVIGGSIPVSGNMDNHRQQPPTNNNNNHMGKRMKVSKGDGYDGSHLNGLQVHDPTASQFLGDHTRVLDDFPELDENMELPDGILSNDIIIFRSLYKEHCESLLDALVNFQMANVESYWRTFWRAGGSNMISGAPMEPQNYENLLPKQKLILLCTFKKVQDFIRDADFHFYQNIVGFLLPDVLRPIPSSMTQAIRNFAKALEGWLTSAMIGFPQEIVTLKVSIVSSLAQTLRRYTSLNHLAQAARAVLQNQNQIAQMLTDLNRVDFNNVEEQASWVCGCDSDIVPSLEQDFKGTLAQQQTLEQWATWLEGVVDRILRPHMTSPKFVYLSRQFLLKWSFYSSLIIRDLTLRSAASFGSFHLLRLLYDEYMFYLVEHRVAQVTGVVPIAVIGKTEIQPQPIMKTEGSLLSDPSSADLMEVFAHTTNTNGSEENALASIENSTAISQNSNRNGITEISVGNMDTANNSSLGGPSSSLIQTSTAVISNQNISHIQSSIKLSPK